MNTNIITVDKSSSRKRHHFIMLTAICMGAFISHFTAGVVNVSLPEFVNIFQSSLGTVQWITTGYLLVIACCLPLMGKLGDRYSYRLIHNLGYVLFSISSMLVAISPNISALLIFRTVQAIGAAMFQSTNIALITLHLPKENRGRALGTVSTAVALGGMTGPIVGGLIVEWFSWHWLFLIHVPIALVATLLAFRYIPDRGQKKNPFPLDSVGALMFMISIGLIILGISNGNTLGWQSIETISLVAVGIIVLSAFLLRDLRQTTPFLPIKAFRIPAVSNGLIVSVASFMFANTVMVSLPFYISGVLGMPLSTAGTVMVAYPILLAFTGPVAGHLSDHFGSRPLMFVGLCGMGCGLAVFALYPGSLPMVSVVATLALIGLGMGLIASPNNSFIMQHAPAEHVGSIGGMIALTRNIGMVIGAALGLGVINGVTEQERGNLLDAFRSVFQINVLLCLGVMVILGCYIHFDNRRNQQYEKE